MTHRLLTGLCLLVLSLVVGCSSDSDAVRRPLTGQAFWDQVEKIVIAPKTDQERVIEGPAAKTFLMRYGPNSLDEMEMESIGYWAEGYIYMAGDRYPIRYAEVAGAQYPGVLVIQGKNDTIRLRQYR